MVLCKALTTPKNVIETICTSSFTFQFALSNNVG